MSKKNFTILGMSYEDYLNMKYRMLKKTIEEQEELECYQEQMKKEHDDVLNQYDPTELPW